MQRLQETPASPPDNFTPLIHRCTSCGELATFHYVGTQYFPKRVTQLRPGAKTSLTLWTCSHCLTTLSDLN